MNESKTEKICKTCNIVKNIKEFHAKKGNSDGKQSQCIDCRRPILREYANKRYKNDLEYRKRTLARHTFLRHQNLEKDREYHRNYRKINKIKLKKYRQKWRIDNKEKERKAKNNYMRTRKKNDLNFKIRCNLSTRLYIAIKSQSIKTKCAKTMELIGCSIESLKKYLENLFKPGMTWENYGYDGWHIDHIKPCNQFDLSNPEQQRTCFHYTNLQPLWATTDIAVSHGDMESIGNFNKGGRFIY